MEMNQVSRRFMGWLPLLMLIIGSAVTILSGGLSQAAVGKPQHQASIRLDQLVPHAVIDLRGESSVFKIKVPISERWSIQRASLKFVFVNSSALLQDRSRLVVRLNGHVLGQIRLEPLSPEGEAQVALPTALLLPGYNDLELAVAQSYTDKCQDPEAPELWTNVVLDKSFLEIDYDLNPVPLSLSAITDFLFDDKLLGPVEVHLVLEDFSATHLKAAALAASGVAIRFNYRPVTFTISNNLTPNVDNIVIGSRAFVAGLLKPLQAALPEGNLAVLHGMGPSTTDGSSASKTPSTDRGHAVVVLTGSAPEAILQAAIVFSSISFPLPDSQSIVAPSIELPNITRYSGKGMVATGETYLLRDLGFNTASLQGLKLGRAELRFRIPADSLVRENDYMILTLDFAYGSAMRPDSVLNLFLNGRLAGSLALDDKKGARYRGYKLYLPGGLLRPGSNTFAFQGILNPSQSGECTYFQTENLIVAIYDSSRLELPKMDHYVRMPQTDLLFKDGFPFASYPDWRETIVVLPRPSSEAAAAALNLVAMICQRNGVPPFAIQFASALPKDRESELIVIGTTPDLPASVLEGSRLSQMSFHAFQGETPRLPRAVSWWREFWPWSRPEGPKTTLGASEMIRVPSGSIPGPGKVLLSTFQSPQASGRTVLLLTAASPQDLQRGIAALWEPAVWSKVYGNLTVIDQSTAITKVYSQQTDGDYYVGRISAINPLERQIHAHPYVAWIAFVVALLVLAWVLRWTVRRRRDRRLPNA